MINYDVFKIAAEVMPEKVMPTTPEELAEFARIVAAAEREACAKVCESEGERIDASWVSCAAAIRARGNE